MARKRWLSTNVSNDRRVAELAKRAGMGAALLYTWSIPHAGDDACLPDDPEEFLSQVAPLLAMRGLVTVDDVQALREHAIQLGLLEETDGHLGFPPASFYGYQSYIGHPRRTDSEQNAAFRTETAHNSAEHSKTAPSSYSSSSSSFYLDRYANATLSTRGRAREIDRSPTCAACSTQLPRRRPAHGLCADCHGKALVAARDADVDVTHISLGDLHEFAIRARA
jgi:hypothetical protein